MMRKVFQDGGVPEDLIYVGLVESAYNPYAQSEAGAKGIWQFVRDTGNRYGLKQIGALDERQDPERSTRAAAQYLRDLYETFGDWFLALAAYNAGEYRVLRIIERTGIKDFWQMISEGLLPEETANYVPAVLAAVIVEKEEFKQKNQMRATQMKSVQIVPSLSAWDSGFGEVDLCDHR
jgi:membrane-bound lytic murein transglycosylase D